MTGERVAVVFGSTGKGAGRSIALTLARDGFSVVVNNRQDSAAAEKVARLVRQLGGQVITVQADATKPDEVKNLVHETLKQFGRIDVCVINPGGGWDTRDLPEIDLDSFKQCLWAETGMIFAVLKYVLPVMRRQKSGRVVLISMETTDLPRVPRWAPYDYILGKSTRIFLARAIAEREKEHEITFNAVCPTAFPHLEPQVALDMARHGEAWNSREGTTPQDIAEAVSFLASEAGRFVTGSIIQLRIQAPS